MADHDNNSDTDDEEHIPRAKGWPIKNKNKNKPPSLTVKEMYLKVTHAKETNEEDKDETMYTSYNKEEDNDKGMTLDSGPSSPDPPNLGQVIYSDDETETTKTLLEDYYEAKSKKNLKLYAPESIYSTKPSSPIHQSIICSS